MIGAESSIEPPGPDRAAVEIEALRFDYGSPTSFRIDVGELRVATGETLAIQGPSGSGKSTLLKLIAAILTPTAGRLEVFGTSLDAASDTMRREFRLRTVGFIFQDYPLVESLSALDNVLLPLRLVPGATPSRESVERGRALLERLDLRDALATKPGALSQGERQRVAIARALVQEAPLVLADEPTTGLDPKRADELLHLLQTLKDERGLTVIAASHDPAVAERCDRVVSIGSLAAEPAC